MVAFSKDRSRQSKTAECSPADDLIYSIQVFAGIEQMRSDIDHAIRIASGHGHFQYLPELLHARDGLGAILVRLRERIALLHGVMDGSRMPH